MLVDAWTHVMENTNLSSLSPGTAHAIFCVLDCLLVLLRLLRSQLLSGLSPVQSTVQGILMPP